MKNELANRRKFGGNRVIGQCVVTLTNVDPFSVQRQTREGYMVLNIRGGCLYLHESLNKSNLEKIFPNGKDTIFQKIVLSSNLNEKVILKSIKASFLRIRRNDKREGVVFRFVDISEAHLDILSKLKDFLPEISGKEEESVPFEEIVQSDPSSKFELL